MLEMDLKAHPESKELIKLKLLLSLYEHHKKGVKLALLQTGS